MAKKANNKGAKKKAVAVEGGSEGHVGHNSKPIPELIEIFKKYLGFEDQKKEIAKKQRDLRNRAKKEFGVLGSSFQHEIAMQKLDKDVRVQQMINHQDLMVALGVQHELDFAGGKPTSASERAQPAEADMPANDDLGEAEEADAEFKEVDE